MSGRLGVRPESWHEVLGDRAVAHGPNHALRERIGQQSEIRTRRQNDARRRKCVSSFLKQLIGILKDAVCKQLGCCGATGWQDYSNYNKQIPHECRDQVTGNMYVYGCNYVLPERFEPFMGWMSGIGLLLIVFQVPPLLHSIRIASDLHSSNYCRFLRYWLRLFCAGQYRWMRITGIKQK